VASIEWRVERDDCNRIASGRAPWHDRCSPRIRRLFWEKRRGRSACVWTTRGPVGQRVDPARERVRAPGGLAAWNQW